MVSYNWTELCSGLANCGLVFVFLSNRLYSYCGESRYYIKYTIKLKLDVWLYLTAQLYLQLIILANFLE